MDELHDPVEPVGDVDTVDPVELWHTLSLAQGRALRAVEEDLVAAGAVPVAWLELLRELNTAPERRLRMQELADRVVRSRTRVSRLVDELVRQGMVVRSPDPADRRSTFAAITVMGRAAVRQAEPVYLAGLGRHVADLVPEADRRAMVSACRRVIDAHPAPSRSRR